MRPETARALPLNLHSPVVAADPTMLSSTVPFARQPVAALEVRADPDPNTEPNTQPTRDSKATSEIEAASVPPPALEPIAAAVEPKRFRVALSVTFLLALLAVSWLVAPIWVGLMLGTVMAFTAQPPYRWIRARLGERRILAAAITTAGGGILTLLGGAAAMYTATRQVLVLVNAVQKKLSSESLEELIGERGARWATALGLDRQTIMDAARAEIGQLSSSVAQAAGVIVSGTTGALVIALMSIFSMYYVLLEWKQISARIERILPLDPRHTRALIVEFRNVGRSAFVGTMVMAVVQGVLAGIGYAIADVSEPVSWGIITALASFIPVVGTAIVWAPCGLYLLFSGAPLGGVFVLAWGALVVMAVSDYLIRPRIVGSKDQGHALHMLVALIGGVATFGLAGLIAGPIIMSLFLSILRIYEREVGGAP